jgi:hypothetical protein
LLSDIVEQATTTTHEFQQAPAGMVVFRVMPKVFCQVTNAITL